MTDSLERLIAPPTWPPSGGTVSCRLTTSTPSPNALSSSNDIMQAIRSKYAEVSVSAEGKFQYLVGKEGAKALGYDPAVIEAAPAEFFKSSCPVGNPFSLGEIKPGSALLDFGCGTGFDLFVASKIVGAGGRVVGIDLTDEMAQRARENLSLAGVVNYEIKTVDSETIPYDDESFDVVVSNGVINLSPNKEITFKEIYRVLKTHGEFHFADIMLEKELPADLTGSAEAWSQWIGGAIPVGDQLRLLQKAGFGDVEHVGATGFRTSQYTIAALFRAKKL